MDESSWEPNTANEILVLETFLYTEEVLLMDEYFEMYAYLRRMRGNHENILNRALEASLETMPEFEFETKKENISVDVEFMKLGNISGNISGNICCICTDDLTEDSTVGALECRHYFHSECLQKWVVMSQTCPVCRASLPVKPMFPVGVEPTISGS